jgi:hypothetical protein
VREGRGPFPGAGMSHSLKSLAADYAKSTETFLPRINAKYANIKTKTDQKMVWQNANR